MLFNRRKQTHNLMVFKNISKLFFLYGMLIFSSNVYATWSSVAVDRTTGEIGIVGASCTFDVQGIASIVPGKGAIVVQAASSYFARMKGVQLMEQNASLKEIFVAMQDKKFEPEKQQYGLILLDKQTKPIVHSGKQIKNWNGYKISDDFAVLGNILVGQKVIDLAFNSFNANRDKPLAERLMLALQAGEQAGGDKRCGSQYASSAFISVYSPNEGAIMKLSVHGIEKGGKPAVNLLSQQFKLWHAKKQAKVISH